MHKCIRKMCQECYLVLHKGTLRYKQRFLFLGFGIEAFCLIGLRFVGTSEIALTLLSVGVGFSGLAISGYQVNPLDLAPQYVSILTGLSRLGTLGAILSTVVAGKLRQSVSFAYGLMIL